MNDDATLHDAKLQEVARRLGARAAEQVDVERIAQAVLTRLRQQPRRTVAAWVWMQPTWLKIAATALLVLGAGLVARAVLRELPTTSAVLVPLSEDLSDLTAEQLREAAGSLEQPLSWEGGAGAVEPGVEGLSTDELRALLRTLEG